MVKIAWEEPEEAFKLFVQSYNARQRLEKKAKAGQGPVTVTQRAGMVENSIQAENVTMNNTAKIIRNVIGPEPGTIGANSDAWLMVKAAHAQLVEARLKLNKNLKDPYGAVWGIFRRDFKVEKGLTGPEWAKAQPEKRASEFARYFREKQKKTKSGRITNAQRKKGVIPIMACHAERKELCKKLGWTDEQFRDFLFETTGERSSSDISLEAYNRTLGLLRRKAAFVGGE